MLAPLAPNIKRRATARVDVIPAPFDGWNARDDLSDMNPSDAIQLDNLIPAEGGVFLRDGRTEWATGLADAIEALMEYNGPDGTVKLFGAVSNAIYDVSTAGAVGAAEVSSLSNARWQHTMFATTGGNFLVAVNGADGVRTYSGSAWATQTITGATAANFVNVASHMSRLWFVEDNTLKVWYLGTLAISGAATSIDFGALSKKGGKLMAMASWTRDGGAGLDDLAVFITSKGEAHVYSGSDPSSADTWARVGTFPIPEPIGHRCVIQIGADLGLLTSQGVVPFSAILPLAQSGAAKVAATERIGKAWKAAYATGAALTGWQVIESPKHKLLIVNVPLVENTTQHQYVMNTSNGKWCRFKNFNVASWGLKGTDLFMGDNSGTVWKYSGSMDDDAVIEGLAISAFNDFGSGRTKHFKRIRPQFFGPPGYRPRVGLLFDYDVSDGLTFTAPSYEQSGSVWNEAEWNVATWADAQTANAWWQGAIGEGFTAAAVISIASNAAVTYNGAKVLYELGDGI